MELELNEFAVKTETNSVKPTTIMNTTILDAGVAIGLAQKPQPIVLAKNPRVTTPASEPRKIINLALLAVAGLAVAVLVFKSVTLINDTLASMEATYSSFCT